MKAVDMHAHIPTKELFYEHMGPSAKETASYFRVKLREVSLEEMINEFEEANVEKIVVVALDAETATGWKRISNDFIYQSVSEYPDNLIGVGSIDPHKGKLALKELDKIRDYGMKGIKFHQAVQQFYPNDPKLYPIYEKCVEYNLHVQFHSGTTGWGAGYKGGSGIKLKYLNPIYVDDVAADFPDLKIILLHPSWPWQDEAIAIALHKPNVFLDLSGWSPKYFPDVLYKYFKLLQDKLVFGTDYPWISPKRWLDDFRIMCEKFKFDEEIINKILWRNAKRILEL